MGFAGIQNFPTVGLIDGVFRANLEETGMSYALEVECIGAARARSADHALRLQRGRGTRQRRGRRYRRRPHGLTTGSAIGARTAKSPWRCA